MLKIFSHTFCLFVCLLQKNVYSAPLSNFNQIAWSFSTELYPDMWGAEWITPADYAVSWAPYLRKKFNANASVRRAVLYACGLGCAEYYINGQKIADDYIDPPMTNYEKEVLYRAYDVTALIAQSNALVAWLGEGLTTG